MHVLRYVPNILTLARFPLGAAFVYYHFTQKPTLAVSLAAVGCITDFFDGYIARRWNITSDFGKIADAYADKWICWMLIIVAFSILGPDLVLILLTPVIAAYDGGLACLRYKFGHRQIPVNSYAKWKTTMLMSGLLLIYLDWLAGYPHTVVTAAAYVSLMLALALALLSIGCYLRGYKLDKYIPYPVNLVI